MDQHLNAFMDLGPDIAPQRIAEATHVAIRTTRQRRAWWPARRFPIVNTNARLGLVAAAVLAVVIVGIGLYARSGVGEPQVSATPSVTPSPVSSPSPSASTLALDNPLIGTWLTPEVTCAQQMATLQAAGFTAEQIASTGDDPTCAIGGTAHYSIVFDDPNTNYNGVRILRQYDPQGVVGWIGVYRMVDGQTFQAGDNGTFFITYRFAIEGDQLTIDMIEDNMPATSQLALLGERLAQTVIYETSPFTRQP